LGFCAIIAANTKKCAWQPLYPMLTLLPNNKKEIHILHLHGALFPERQEINVDLPAILAFDFIPWATFSEGAANNNFLILAG
jgi:hypothetical protein